MKTRKVLCAIFAFLFLVGWQLQLGAQDIPANYIQNPNMEHELNAIFWYGSWDYTYGSGSIANFPEVYLSQEEAHSGNWSMKLIPGGWVWVSYPIRGHEEKKFKASFWYKGYFNNYWNFLYRDAGVKYEDAHWTLAEYVGADSAGWGGEGQDAIQFWFGGEDGFTEEWTYFEYVWDWPGELPGWGNTSMWWGEYDPIYLDDFYYGEWYDGQYSGEEPFGFINGDFEATDLNGEWLVNVDVWTPFQKDDFLSLENHTEDGLQSLRLSDYKTIQLDSVGNPIDTSDRDRNVTYYLPVLGAEGMDMELNFWYKGNDASLDLQFYGNYGITPDEFPLPDGATLVLDEDNAVHEIITVLRFDDASSLPVDTSIAFQQFEDSDNLALPGNAWLWSGSDYYTWDDWTTGVTDMEAYSGSSSFILPGDPNWTGAEGSIKAEDNNTYVWSFWYKGKAQFDLMLGDNCKYDLTGDPDGIVPEGAVADSSMLHWDLMADEWTQFTYGYAQGSWLADSGLTEPVDLVFNLIGTYDALDTGYVDDLFVGIVSDYDKPFGTMFTVEPDTLSTTIPPLAARWDLPAADDWTEWMFRWTNPSTDIGGNLTLILDNDMLDDPAYIPVKANDAGNLIPEEDFDDMHAGWTFFDDFYYGESTLGINPNLVKYDLHTYPNPARDVLYLSIQSELSRIRVHNALGQLQMDLDRPERVMDISELSEGIYFLNVTDMNGVVHKAKFIKQ